MNKQLDLDWGDEEADRQQQELLDREVRGEFDGQLELPFGAFARLNLDFDRIMRDGTG